MAHLVHPSLILRAHLDSSDYSGDCVRDLKRAYLHIAPIVVSKSALPEDSQEIPINVLTLQIVMHSSFWDANDAQANMQWEIMPHWLDTVFYKVSNNIVEMNSHAALHKEQKLLFRKICIDFDGVFWISILSNEDGSIPKHTRQKIENIRTIYAAGALGKNSKGIEIPPKEGVKAKLLSQMKNSDPKLKNDQKVVTVDQEAKLRQNGTSVWKTPEDVPYISFQNPMWRIYYEDGHRALFDPQTQTLA